MSMEHALSVLLDHSKEAEVVGLQSKTHLLSLHSSSSSSPNEVVYSHQAHQTSLESSAEQQQQQQQQQMNSSRSNSSGSCLEHVGAFSNRFDLNGTNGRRRHNHATSTAITANGEERWNSFDNRWETEGEGGKGETETNELDHSHEVCEGYESESSLDSSYEDSLHMAALIGKSLLDRNSELERQLSVCASELSERESEVRAMRVEVSQLRAEQEQHTHNRQLLCEQTEQHTLQLEREKEGLRRQLEMERRESEELHVQWEQLQATCVSLQHQLHKHKERERADRIGLRRGRMGSGGDGAEWRGALEIEEGVMRRTHSVDQLAASGGGQGGSALFPAVSLSSNRYRVVCGGNVCGGVRVKRVEWEKRQLQTQVDRLEHDLHSLSTAQDELYGRVWAAESRAEVGERVTQIVNNFIIMHEQQQRQEHTHNRLLHRVNNSKKKKKNREESGKRTEEEEEETFGKEREMRETSERESPLSLLQKRLRECCQCCHFCCNSRPPTTTTTTAVGDTGEDVKSGDNHFRQLQLTADASSSRYTCMNNKTKKSPTMILTSPLVRTNGNNQQQFLASIGGIELSRPNQQSDSKCNRVEHYQCKQNTINNSTTSQSWNPCSETTTSPRDACCNGITSTKRESPPEEGSENRGEDNTCVQLHQTGPDCVNSFNCESSSSSRASNSFCSCQGQSGCSLGVSISELIDLIVEMEVESSIGMRECSMTDDTGHYCNNRMDGSSRRVGGGGGGGGTGSGAGRGVRSVSCQTFPVPRGLLSSNKRKQQQQHRLSQKSFGGSSGGERGGGTTSSGRVCAVVESMAVGESSASGDCKLLLDSIYRAIQQAKT
ncbi:uncharacterized protein LOC134855180 isoform X1 [Symsagittifera roscoffensis]|uniref:uncharacterized protein LOC134855180 isoform X1 n=1 Tax=Symsagittifera roscoffensis TaxID=84072 RepID=UPI00307B1374